MARLPTGTSITGHCRQRPGYSRPETVSRVLQMNRAAPFFSGVAATLLAAFLAPPLPVPYHEGYPVWTLKDSKKV